MKILFLDVDGVLNNHSVFMDKRFGPSPLDHFCIDRLHKVVCETNCAIVLSSAWRGVPHLERKLEAEYVFDCYFRSGIDMVFTDYRHVRHEDGSTKRLVWNDYQGRGSEIAEWLSRHPEVSRYAIVDDESDMLPDQMPFFVRTTFETGMTDEHAAKLVEILNRDVA